MHKLRACRRYHVTFDGIAESDERGDSSATFHTPDPSCPDFVAIGVSANCPSRLQPSDTNLWSHLAKSLDVRRPCLPSLVPALSGPTMHLQVPWHGVDVMLHLGGQIPLATAMQEAIHFLREASAKGAEGAVIDAAIKERFREEYRTTWNLPSARAVLSKTSHLSVWSARHLLDGFVDDEDEDETEASRAKASGATSTDDSPPERAISTSAQHVLGLAREVYREYERQLWDDDWAQRASDDLEGGFVTWGAGRIGALMLDTGEFVEAPSPEGARPSWA